MDILYFLYPENPAIVAGFYVGYADEQKPTKRQRRFFVSKAPSERGLPTELGGGECEMVNFVQIVNSVVSFRHANACHLPLGGRLWISPARAGLRNSCMAGRPI